MKGGIQNYFVLLLVIYYYSALAIHVCTVPSCSNDLLGLSDQALN